MAAPRLLLLLTVSLHLQPQHTKYLLVQTLDIFGAIKRSESSTGNGNDYGDYCVNGGGRGPMRDNDIRCGGTADLRCTGGCLRINKVLWSCNKGDNSPPDQINRVRDRCEGKQSCFINPRTFFSTDECPDVAQSNFVLWLTYSCDGGTDGTNIDHGNGGGQCSNSPASPESFESPESYETTDYGTTGFNRFESQGSSECCEKFELRALGQEGTKVRIIGVFGGYIRTGRQHGGAPAYKCDSGAGFYVWKDNDGTWRANHEKDGGIGGDDHIRSVDKPPCPTEVQDWEYKDSSSGDWRNGNIRAECSNGGTSQPAYNTNMNIGNNYDSTVYNNYDSTVFNYDSTV